MRHPMPVLLLLCLASPVCADDGADPAASPAFEFIDAHRLGMGRHQLDDYTRVTGWQISRQWYFGQQRGKDSALGFVWQGDAEQMSISTDGIRFIRRF